MNSEFKKVLTKIRKMASCVLRNHLFYLRECYVWGIFQPEKYKKESIKYNKKGKAE